jgi:hypothetical protein
LIDMLGDVSKASASELSPVLGDTVVT